MSSYPSTPLQAREALYTDGFSVADDAKGKANQLSNAAAQELEKATSKAQDKTGKIEMFTPKYYAACTFGGLLACGLTHTAVTPLDLVKCRRQVDAKLYKGNFEACRIIGRSEGLRGILLAGLRPSLATASRVQSSMEDTNSSRNSILIWLAKRLLRNTRRACTWRPVPRPSSLPTLACAR